jgi:predicted LPLAT superfamily acyltransferase
MVINFPDLGASVGIFLAKHSTDAVIERLDPPRRAAVLMTLLGLVLLGLVLVACAMIGAHWVRAMARYKPGAVRAKATADAAHNRQLREALASVLPEGRTEDTVHLGRTPSDTKVDL